MSVPELVKPKGREFQGGDLLAQSLKLLGVEVAFGIHGGHLDAFLMGANDIGIKLVDTRHETVGVQAAEGYAKLSGKVGVCFVTANSGFSNGLPGLATAFADRSPVFCITSSVPLRDAEANVLQGFHDQVVLAKPITKFAHRATCVEEIPRLVSHAFRIATAGAPGPTLIDFPIDVLFSPVRPARIAWGSITSPRSFPPGTHPEAIAEAAGMLRAAKRPVIVTGTGAYGMMNKAPWESFINSTQIPVFHSNKWSSPLPFNHPLRGGNAANLAVLKGQGKPPPDVILLIGCRMGFFFGSRTDPVIPRPENTGSKYIHVDVDPGEVGRDLPVALGVTSDALAFIWGLRNEFGHHPWKASPDWVREATSLKSTTTPTHEKEPQESDGGMHPYHAIKAALSGLPPESIISIDGGDCGSWASQLMENARPNTVMFSCGYLGFLGNGYGYCLGAAIAKPEALVVNIQGDGSGGMHVAELDTYVRHNVRVLTIVINNSFWGMSANGQELIYGKATDARPAAKLSEDMSYAATAEGLACPGIRVSKVGEIGAAVKKLTSEKGPGLLELVTDRHPIHPGTVAMVGNSDDKKQIVVPYYDNIPRPDGEYV